VAGMTAVGETMAAVITVAEEITAAGRLIPRQRPNRPRCFC